MNKEEKNRNQRVGGKWHEVHAKYNILYRSSGIPREKYTIRRRHERRWGKYKRIIAFETQIHHEWIPNTSQYRGVALVEKNQHQHGIIDVIQIINGEITLFTEETLRQ